MRLCNQLQSAAVYTASPVAFHEVAFPVVVGMKLPIVFRMLQFVSTFGAISLFYHVLVMLFFAKMPLTSRLYQYRNIA